MKSTHCLNFLTASICSILTCHNVIAQTNEQNSEGDIVDEEVVWVTGSRIQRNSFTTPMPMVGISRADLESIGSNSLADALLEVPSIVEGLSQTNTTTNLQNSGLSSVDLRNLDDNRTLVLIDGRRAVSNSGNSNRVSLGTIPAGFVDRVEIITGGASAIYGSDAVAGVVNIITKERQEGLEFDARYGEGRSGAYDDKTFDLSYGLNFANNRGYFLAAINYDEESGIRAIDVSDALIQASWDYEVDSGLNTFETAEGDQPARDITRDQYADLSSDPDGGRFDGSNFWYDDNGLREDFVTNRDGFDFRKDDDILIPRERINYAVKFNFNIDENLEFFTQLIHSDVETDNLREPEGDDYNDPHTLFDFEAGTSELIEAGRIPIDNPFAPQIIIDNESAAGIRWDRRFVEVGLQRTLNERKTTRFWSGLRGVAFEDWKWEASVGYGRYEQEQLRFNEINILNLTQGLNAEVGPDGEIRCADADARAAGCVPVNLFGRGSITPEAADYIRANLGLETEIEQINALAYISGDVLDLPAGSMKAVFGMEYRDDELDLMPDELNRTGGHSSNFVPAFSGQTDVIEVFSEFSIPLLADLPGAEELTLDLSARFAEYSQENVGSVTSFGSALQWRPVDELNFRTTFNRAHRAPDLAELFSPPRGDTDSFDDICEGVTLDTEGIVAENCRAEPGVLANIQENGEFIDENAGKFSPNAGNEELFEETADTFTAGIVWQPSAVEGLSLSIDYYNIEIEDAITSFSNDDILAQCYESTNFGDQNFFCNEITRDDDGQIVTLIQRELNLESIETRGIDTVFNYDFDLAQWNIPGEFDIRYVHTHVSHYEITGQGAEGVVVNDVSGELDNDNFDDRSVLRLGWNNENFRVTWRVKYFSETTDDNDLKEDYQEALANNPDAEKPLYLDIDEEFFHDVYLAYTLEAGEGRYRIYAGVRNVFDNTDPFLPAGTSGGSDNLDDIYGTIKGRYSYLGFNIKI